jgi:hypothetical protein
MFKLIKNNEILAYSSGAVGWGAVSQTCLLFNVLRSAWAKISLHVGGKKFCTQNE